MSLVSRISDVVIAIANRIKNIETGVSSLQTSLPKFKTTTLNVPVSYDYYETSVIDSYAISGCFISCAFSSNDENELEDLYGIVLSAECVAVGTINIKMSSEFIFGGNINIKYMIGFV